MAKIQKISIVPNLPVSFRRDRGPEGIESPNGPDKVNYHVMMAYYNHEKGQYQWVNEFDDVKTGAYTASDNVKMFELSERYPIYSLEISDLMSPKEVEKTTAIVNFLKEWPMIAHATSAGKVNSFPTENHKLHFKNVYKIDPKTVLSISVQPFKIIDENVVEKSRFDDNKKVQRFILSLTGLENDETAMEKVVFLLGLNPIGLTAEKQFNLIYDNVINNERFEEFHNIIENKAYDDPAQLAVSIALTEGIVYPSEAGIYQFQGEVISKDIAEVAYYFRSNKVAWNALRIELVSRNHTIPDEPLKIEESKTYGSVKKKPAHKEVEEDVI